MAPPMPWKTFAPIDPDATYVVTITRLPLRRHWRIPMMGRWTARIVRELARSDGLVGYSMKAYLLSKTFWTMSAWQSEEAQRSFARSKTHREAMAAIAPHMHPATIETSSASGHDLPLTWRTVTSERRLRDRQ